MPASKNFLLMSCFGTLNKKACKFHYILWKEIMFLAERIQKTLEEKELEG